LLPGSAAIVLYHWAWYDQRQGEIISGWSQRGTGGATKEITPMVAAGEDGEGRGTWDGARSDGREDLL
jgi:hypothetical protein